MINGQITTTEHGCVAKIDGKKMSVDMGILEKISRSYGYREHLTLWSDDVSASFLELIGTDIDDKTKLSIGGGDLRAFHRSKVHIRGVDGYTDATTRAICSQYGRADDTDGRLDSNASLIGDIANQCAAMGLAKMKGTAAGSAHELWREKYNPGGRWRFKQSDAATEDLDFIRRGLYGGQTCAHVRGVIYTPGNMPRALVKNLGAPAYETPAGHRIFRIDARSAYPSVMRLDMPSPWHATTDEFCLKKYKHGVADVSVKVNQSGPRILPVRINDGEDYKTIWPTIGIIAGVYTYTLLREAVKHGAEIIEVKRAISYTVSRAPLKTLVSDIWKASQGIENPIVAKCIKGFSRRLNGKFAVSRWRTKLTPLSDYMDLLERDSEAPLPKQIIGNWCVTREREEQYPAFSQPLWAALTIDRATVVLSRVVHELETSGIRVLYVDTDSVMFCAQEGEHGAPVLPPTVAARMGDGLGQWRVDWCGNWVAILGSKFYATDTSCSFAGVPLSIQDELLHNGSARHTTRGSIFSGPRTLNYRIHNGEVQENE